MAVYQFRARDSGGSEVTGELEGADTIAVATTLQRRGLIPVQIEEKQESASFDLSALLQRNIPLDELVIFSRQMYALTKAGHPYPSRNQWAG